MKYLKIHLEDNAEMAKIIELTGLIRGVKSIEIVDSAVEESDLKKAFSKGKEQIKKGEFEDIVNDIFDLLNGGSSKKPV